MALLPISVLWTVGWFSCEDSDDFVLLSVIISKPIQKSFFSLDYNPLVSVVAIVEEKKETYTQSEFLHRK